ncbi:prepilin peptidase [Enterococcus faecalis]|nr:prepilin peptidase [Enterococcus faecalis]EGO8594730.1 prepilin peptidase [Enterococcus faecalis]EHA3992599.1 prepilin peptidase [Enterococcus faecalis]EHQ8827450.1 prepilin peptidase [Enterococcus faecalis]HAP3647627.1 prepilin peptidase [Enterococcus faecalis]
MFFLSLFLIGACFGSFLCLVAERLPVGRSLWRPPSHCQGCYQPLQLYELIPVVSILLQRFRCRKCQQPVAKSYLLAELVMGGLTASCFSAGLTIDALILWWWLTSAFTLSLIDYWYLVVEPKILYPSFFVLCLLKMAGQHSFYLLTGLFCFCFFRAVLYYFPEAMGRGDLLLLGLWGCFLQVPQLLMLLFFASSYGLIYGYSCKFLRYPVEQKLPFVPFLSLGLLTISWL